MRKQKILEKISKNEWLNGIYDCKNGEFSETYIDKVNKINDLNKMIELLLNFYEGIYLFKNFVFGVNCRYGNFVYIIKNNEIKEFENLTFDNKEKYEDWFEKVLKINRKTKTCKEFIKSYFGI